MVKFGVIVKDERCGDIFEALNGTLRAAKVISDSCRNAKLLHSMGKCSFKVRTIMLILFYLKNKIQIYYWSFFGFQLVGWNSCFFSTFSLDSRASTSVLVFSFLCTSWTSSSNVGVASLVCLIHDCHLY